MYFVTLALLPVYLEDDFSIAGNTAASLGWMAAVMAVGVAVAVLWMWRRQWVLPCASNVTLGTFYRSF